MLNAMVLSQPNHPLSLPDIPIPTPGPYQLLLRVLACGVCRTDLHIYDGDLDQPKLPLILGHEIVGRVEAVGANGTEFQVGDRVGVPWLGSTDGTSAVRRTFVKTLNSLVTPWMAAMLNLRQPTSGSAFTFHKVTAMRMLLRCCVPG